jgi:LysM repeat protein
MRASLGKTCRKYASTLTTGLVSAAVLAATALTLGAPSAAAARLQAPPGVHLVHAPTSRGYPARTAAKPDAHLAAATTPLSHTVVSGDTLSGIAASYLGAATEWRGLCAANSLTNCDLIYVGQGIRLATATVAVATTPIRPAYQAPVYHAPTYRSTYVAPTHHATATTGSYGRVSPEGYSGFQACVVRRESGGNSQVMNGSGHYGLYQFDRGTWESGGGSAADFGHASVAEQNRVFANVYAARGTNPWAPYDGC